MGSRFTKIKKLSIWSALVDHSNLPENKNGFLGGKKIYLFLNRTLSTDLEAQNCINGNGSAMPHQEKKIILPPVTGESFTALKWARKALPDMPIVLLRKFFRKRQVKLLVTGQISETPCLTNGNLKWKRVKEGDFVPKGSQVSLPSFVPLGEGDQREENMAMVNPSEEEIEWMRSLIIYKDPHVIVLNKPSGVPVQGGSKIKKSIDSLMRKSLAFEKEEAPRLIHRLDKDTSGCLLLGRTEEATRILHEYFRNQTESAMTSSFETKSPTSREGIKKIYWAVVAGRVTKREGIIEEPLNKLRFVSNGRLNQKLIESTNNDDGNFLHAVTKYKVLKTVEGFSFLELSPMTGRKHQLRIHCAEVLKLPIVGDYKYGNWATERWQPSGNHYFSKHPISPQAFGGPDKVLEGSIWSKRPYLHLHCHSLSFPDLSLESTKNQVNITAPLPPHMAFFQDFIDKT